jgi:recombination associated protein RdgC
MWFKNLVVYRLPADWSVSAADLDSRLSGRPLQQCSGYDLHSRGWVSPLGNGRYVHTLQGHHLFAMGVNQKLLPASIVNQVTKERAAELAAQQVHPVGRRQMRELKERVADELRAKAFTRRTEMRAWLDPQRGRLVVDTASVGKAEELVETLRETFGSFAVQPLQTAKSPSAAMGGWLMTDEAPGRFNIEQDLELQAKDDTRSTVRYARHPLDGKEIHKHLASGKSAVRLGLSWNARVAFVLTSELQVRRVQFLAVEEDKAETADEAAEQFDIEFALMSGELGNMLDDLVRALGGEEGKEQEEGVAAQVPQRLSA